MLTDKKPSQFLYRNAALDDIPKLQEVLNSVVENVLSDPSKVTDEMVAEYISRRGKGWVCETEDLITGFSIVDLQEDNVWALFVRPEYEGLRIGKQLHQLMLNWYFAQGKQGIWLSTEPGTRAADFYLRQGWRKIGLYGSDEIKFEMTAEEWKLK